MASLELSDEENELGPRADGNDRASDDDGGFRSDEAEEDRPDQDPENGGGSTARRIDPATSRKRVVRNPQPKLNAERIQGPKGVQTIEKYFEGFKFRGKGHEKSDLDKVMKRLEHWAHRLFPKYQFDDFLEKMETLGTKKNVQVYLKKYRLGMETPHVDIVDPDDEGANEMGEQPAPEEAPADEFDKLIAEQIEKQRRVTDQQGIVTDKIPAAGGNVLGTAKHSEMSDEIKARIEANRKLAIERKNARLRKIEEETRKRKLDESQEESQVIEEETRKRKLESQEDSQVIEEETRKRKLESREDSQVIEEETRKRKLESQEDSQVIESSNAQIRNLSPSPEQRNEDVSKKIRAAIRASAMEVSSTISEEDNTTIQEPVEELTSKSEKSPGQAASKKLSDTTEILDELHSVQVSASNGIFDKNDPSRDELEDIEDVPDEMEYSNVARTYGSTNRKSKDDPEKLLSKEELQREIDNAIEEIISRNAHKNK